MTTSYLRFSRKDCLVGVLIILLAFIYRVAIIVDRAHAPGDVSAFFPPPGTDQLDYYNQIREYHQGTFPPRTYYFQPGASWFMVLLSLVMRTDDLGALRIGVAALAALNCGLMLALAQLAFGRRWVSYLAGLLLALYPVSAFYDTDFVITSQATILLTGALFSILWLWRQPHHWAVAILFGLCGGIILLMRRELALVIPIMGLLLLWKQPRRRTVLHLCLAAGIAIGVTVPVIAHNKAGGADYLITPVGLSEIYRGNNRDTGGTHDFRQARATTNDNYLYYLWQDILLSPRRFIELELRKVALYLSSSEPGNNLNYAISGKAISPALMVNPLNFSVLLALFTLGLWVAWRQGEAAWSIFGILFLACMASTVLVWVEARVRTPVVAVMIPPAAYGLVLVAEQIVKAWKEGLQPTRLRKHITQWGVPAVVIPGLLMFSTWGEFQLPRMNTVQALPETVQASHVVYDDTLELVGWDIEDAYSPPGLIQPFRPYVVALYWRLLKPTTTDYSFALSFYVNHERVIGVDYPIGTVSYPDIPTSQWEPGVIYVERVGMTYKEFVGPIRVTGDLLLQVYPERNAEALLAAEGLENSPTFVRLTQPAIMLGVSQFDTLPLADGGTPFGQVLLLKSWDYPETAHTGETIPVRLGWGTTAEQIQQSYSIGIYALAETGEVAAQADSPPQEGRLLTWSLPTNYLLEDTKSIQLPETPGRYSLYVGVYNQNTMERLTVPDTTNNLFKLGEIQVSRP